MSLALSSGWLTKMDEETLKQIKHYDPIVLTIENLTPYVLRGKSSKDFNWINRQLIKTLWKYRLDEIICYFVPPSREQKIWFNELRIVIDAF